MGTGIVRVWWSTIHVMVYNVHYHTCSFFHEYAINIMVSWAGKSARCGSRGAPSIHSSRYSCTFDVCCRHWRTTMYLSFVDTSIHFAPMLILGDFLVEYSHDHQQGAWYLSDFHISWWSFDRYVLVCGVGAMRISVCSLACAPGRYKCKNTCSGTVWQLVSFLIQPVMCWITYSRLPDCFG